MKRLLAVAVCIVAGCVVFMQWEQLATLKVVAHALRRPEMTDPGPMGVQMRWQVGWTTDTPPKPVWFEKIIDRNPGETVTHQDQRYIEEYLTERAAHPPIN